MGDSRRMLDYSDLWEGGGIDAGAAAAGKGADKTSALVKGVGSNKVQSLHYQANNTNGAHKGWSQDGTPQTASSSRKVRKILTLIGAGNLAQAELELAKMGPAKNNYEIQRAMSMAKAGKRTAGSGSYENGAAFGSCNQEGDADYDDDYDMEEEDGDEGHWGEGGEEEGEEGEEGEDKAGITMDATFDWQGGMNGFSGKQLSHEEIWDDSALLDAWNAAEEEYKIFHARRTQHEEGKTKAGIESGTTVVQEEDSAAGASSKKRSALWYDSPAVGSPAALAAKTAAKEEQERMKVALEERKKRARALLDQVAGPSSAAMGAAEEELLPATSTAEPPAAKRKKQIKGVTPPSSSISGNLAWHSACATVSRTPNEIGDQGSARHSDISASSHQTQGGEETTATSGSNLPQTATAAAAAAAAAATQGEEIFQNLAMAWYYAGYYQAMAVKWTSEQNGSG